MLLAWSWLALGYEIPPFEANQRFYLSPTDFAFAHAQVDRALEGTDHAIYVVVFEAVADGRVPAGRESETEEALEAVWAQWKLQGVDAAEASLAVMSMDEREVRLLAGSRWDVEFFLHNAALVQIIDDHFMPRAVTGDLDGALADLVTGYDRTLTARTQAAARAAEQAARDAAAAAEREAREALAEAERAEREARAAAERAARARERWEALRRRMPAILGVGAALGLALVLLATIALLRTRSARAEQAFRAAFDGWQQRIRQAETNFADLHITVELRDQVVELKTRGQRTTAVYSEVVQGLDRIQVGLTALRRHVDACAPHPKPGWLASRPWILLAERLERPFSFDTGRVAHRLFEGPTVVIEVDPKALADEIAQRFEAAAAGWQRLVDAVEASMREARQDLPRTDWTTAREALAAESLPQTWTRGHPLDDDPDRFWDALDAVRRADPVGYLERLEEAQDLADDVEERVAEVVYRATAAEAALEQAGHEDVSGLDTVIDLEDRDPEVPHRAAVASMEELRRLLAAAEDAASVSRASNEVVQHAYEWRGRKRALLETVETVAARVDEATAALGRLQTSVAAAQQRAAELAKAHALDTMGVVFTELAEASTDHAEGQAVVARANDLLTRRHHAHAEKLCFEAMREHREGSEDYGQLVAAMDRLQADRLEADGVWKRIDEERARRAAELSGLGGHGDGVLAAGDAAREAVRASWREGAADWGARLLALKGVLAAWDGGVREARAAYAEEQRREQERRRAEARAAAERARRQRTSSSHSYRSSGRSGGSGFGSSGRSGGSGFKSSGRSGGRRF